jgi:hypothetical protein
VGRRKETKATCSSNFLSTSRRRGEERRGEERRVAMRRMTDGTKELAKGEIQISTV